MRGKNKTIERQPGVFKREMEGESMKTIIAEMALWLPWIALCVVALGVWWADAVQRTMPNELHTKELILVDIDTLPVIATVMLTPSLDTMESVMMDTCCYAYYLDGRLLLIHPSPRLYYIRHDLMTLVSREEMDWFLDSVKEGP